MKRFILLTSISFFGFIHAHAQITYYATDFLQVNDSMLFSENTLGLNSFNFDTTGANIFWDYSNLNHQTQTTKTFFNPDNSGYKNPWCLSKAYVLNCNTNFQNLTNLAINELDSISLGQISLENRVSHQRLNGNVLKNNMIGLSATISGTAIPFTFEFEDQDSIYQFPIQFNGSDSSTSRLILDLFPAPIIQAKNSKRVNIVDGWGSLQTPFGTFTNVLKMKTTIERWDTLYLDTIIIPSHITEVEYKWWDAASGLPVLQAKGNIIANIVTITKVSYLDSIRCIAPQSFFSYFPLFPILDSASKTVQVQFNNLSTNADSVIWDLGDGSITHSYSPNHIYSCSGTKNIQLISFTQCNSGWQSDTFSFPLLISDTTSIVSPDTTIINFCSNDSVLINGKYENQSGFYAEILSTTSGCDSLLIISLIETIIDTSLQINSSTITANMSNATYQWLDCNNSRGRVLGATGQSYTPNFSGSFAVKISYNGCVDTSSCESVSLAGMGMEDISKSLKLAVYPNPGKDRIQIDTQRGLVLNYKVYSLIGEELISTTSSQIDIGILPPGTYLICGRNTDGVFVQNTFVKIP